MTATPGLVAHWVMPPRLASDEKLPDAREYNEDYERCERDLALQHRVIFVVEQR